MHHSWAKGDFEISTDPARIDVDLVHEFLTASYWAQGIPVETVRRSIENSISFGIYHGGQQVGFARIISDLATFAYLADVFVLPTHRGRGLSRWLMECIVGHPDLQGLRRWMLATRDAHGLYAQFGFTAVKKPERWMELHHPDIYAKTGGSPFRRRVGGNYRALATAFSARNFNFGLSSPVRLRRPNLFFLPDPRHQCLAGDSNRGPHNRPTGKHAAF
jgi:GNAT superfamily N-acetyltransferase